MTGRTHDLAAFSALNLYFVTQALVPISWGTLVVALGVNMIGGLLPDLDNASASIWKKVRGGKLLGTLIAPLMGGHRMISHSLVGLFLAGWLGRQVLDAASTTLIVDVAVVWVSFMIGMVSHLVMDAVTKEGIPLLFPIPIHVGFPPLAALRIKTGSIVEKGIVFPGLVLLNGYLFWQYQDIYLTFLRDYVGTV